MCICVLLIFFNLAVVLSVLSILPWTKQQDLKKTYFVVASELKIVTFKSLERDFKENKAKFQEINGMKGCYTSNPEIKDLVEQLSAYKCQLCIHGNNDETNTESDESKGKQRGVFRSKHQVCNV